MLTKEQAIVLRVSDYKEKDKIVTLFSLDNGLIKAVAKGVKAEKAKLKFAAMPFCFAEFELTSGAGMSIISGANLIENFFGLTKNLETYYAGCSILKIVENIASFGEYGQELFVLILKSLKSISDYVEKNIEDENVIRLIKIKFILGLCDLNGIGINFSKCGNCGKLTHDEIFFNQDVGHAVCRKCHEQTDIPVTLRVVALIMLIQKTDFSQMPQIKCSEGDMLTTETLLYRSFQQKTGYKFE